MKLLTLKEIAEKLDVPPKSIYYLIYIGRLEGFKIRSTWRFLNDAAENLC